MADLVRVHRVQVFPQTLDERPETRRSMPQRTLIQRLWDAGYGVQQHEDVDKATASSNGPVTTRCRSARQCGQAKQDRAAAEA